MNHPSVAPIRTRRATLCALMCALLAACGGGGGGGGAAPEVRAFALGVSSGYKGVTDSAGLIYNDGSGDGSGGDGGGGGGGGGESGGAGAGAGLGTFVNAVVTVERADGTVVGTAVTDAFGMVSIRNGGNKQPLLITVQGAANATYWDEALQQKLPFPASESLHVMLAATGTAQTLSKNVGITPLTEAAYQYAVAKLGGVNAWRTAANIALANQAVATEINRFLPSTLAIEDITRLPALVRDETAQVLVGSSKNITYGLVSAALVRAAKLHTPGSAPGIALSRQLSLDLTDAKIDGIGPGSVALDPKAYNPSSLSADVLVGMTKVAEVNAKTQPVTAYRLSGTVTGLFAAGLELTQGAAVQAAPANASGFTLGAVLVAGSAYEVTVKTQPAGQVCSVSNGSGITGTADVGNVAVTCVTPPPPSFSVAGSVSGLAGSGLVLQTNGGNNLPVSANGPATFAAALPAGGNFSVTVLTQPGGQLCSVANGSGTLTANVTNVSVTCAAIPPSTFTLGGTVTGLAGSGLVLRNNGGSDLSVVAAGGFTFAAPIAAGAAYSVTVAAQPSNPSQTCAVAAGSGTATGNVGSVNITCTTSSFSVGGTVSGLSGTGLVLQNNGGDSLAVSVAGTFTFATPVASGSAYGVTVASQPPGQNCSVNNGAGTVIAAAVSNVSITCAVIPPDTFTIGGTVAGLAAGSNLVLQYNGANNQAVGSSGGFTFATPIVAGTAYAVTVATQPSNPTQTCVVSTGSGTAAANVVNVSVNCTTNTYAVRVTVSGLVGGGLVLQNNGTSNLSISGNGSFPFATPVASGAAYGVTILAQPSGQICAVSSGAGLIVAADVTNVTITCTTLVVDPVLSGTVSGLVGGGLVLQNNGSNNLSVSANGSFTFGLIANGSAYAVTVATQPSNPAQTCVVNNGSGTATGNFSVAVTCTTTAFTVGGTVSGASASGLVLQNNGGDTLTITANGAFTFATPVANGSAYGVTIISQPPGQICNVGNGTGTVGLANVTSVTVTCGPIPVTTVTIGGTVSGLAGTGLVLQNNSADPYVVTSNGGFTFSAPIQIGTSFNVSVRTQPSNPTQTCVVSNATGQPSSNVNNVSVTCTTSTFGVSGTVSGLAGSGLVLVNNGSNNLAVSGNGNVSFTTPVASGAAYNVTVLTQPTNPFQACSVTNGSGTVGAANVVNVSVSCSNRSARYAYVTNSGDNTISSYAVDAASGRLKFIDKAATGASPKVVTVDPTQRFAYVVNNGNATVSQYTIAANGSLTPMTPATVPAGSNSDSVAVDPSGGFAYVTNCGNATLSQYTVGATGGLTPITGAPSVSNPGCPVAVVVHPNGRFAYAANNNSNSVSQYAIGVNGALTPLAVPTVAAGANPGHVTVDPTGRFVYVTNSNGTNISQYTIGTDGGLTPVTGAPTVLAPGPTPNAVSIDPSGRFAYASIYGNGVVAQFSIGASGALTPITGAPTVAAGFAPAFVKTDPSGRFAYVVNGGGNDISQYAIGSDGGLLPNALVSVTASGNGPSSMAFSSGVNASAAIARYAYAVNGNVSSAAGSVSQYTVSANGTLVANGSPVSVGFFPQHVAVDPAGRYAYVANFGGGVSQFTIGSGGALAPMSPATATAQTSPYAVTIHPNGRYAYVANYSSGTVSQFTLGPTGGLVAMTNPTVLAGSLPISVTIDPSGRFAYVANYGGDQPPVPGTVSQYTIGSDGSLAPMSPATVPTGNTARTVTVDPTGRYAYVANRYDSTVSQFTIGANGALASMSQATLPVGTPPASIAIEPSGRYAYIVGDANIVTQWQLGPTGGLAAITSPAGAGTTPTNVSVDPSGKYAYVSNYNSNNVSMYSINSNGALSPLVATVPSGTVAAGTNPTAITSIGSWQ